MPTTSQSTSTTITRLADRWTGRMRQAVKWLLFLPAVIIALASYRYLLDLPPVPPSIGANRYRALWLVLHAGSAATALLTGGAQFARSIRVRRPAIHRITGRVYVAGCLTGAASGLVLAFGSSAGPVATAGFGSLAVAWAATTCLGWHHAREWRFADHRFWMMRSWALTLSAVTLRVYIVVAEIGDLPEVAAYQAISFLCWVPNLALAEYLLRRSGKRPTAGCRHRAGCLSLRRSCPTPSSRQ